MRTTHAVRLILYPWMKHRYLFAHIFPSLPWCVTDQMPSATKSYLRGSKFVLSFIIPAEFALISMDFSGSAVDQVSSLTGQRGDTIHHLERPYWRCPQMKAIRVNRPGGPEALELQEIPIPIPMPGQALVRMKAAGVNFLDVYERTGFYTMTHPFTPGNEGSGVVEAIGEGVTEVAVGDRVAWATHGGSYAQYAVVPAWKLAPLPDSMSFEQGAAVMLQGMTAHYLALSTFPIRTGHRVLVHAAAGGVGLLLVQIAKQLGATVYGTVGNAQKAAMVKAAGADAAILYTETDFAAAVSELTKGAGLHAVYDSVGQTTFAGSMKCLAPRGYLLLFGQSSGPVAPIEPSALARGSFFLSRPRLPNYLQDRAELLERTTDLFNWVASGQLKVQIDTTFPLNQAADSHRRIESRQSVGKIVLAI